MKRALLLAALVAVPAAAETAPLTLQTGQWYRIFSPDVERAIGRSVRVDAASVGPGGLGRQFRQVGVLLRKEGTYPKGTAIYARRSVNCQGGLKLTYEWSAVTPAGVAIGGQTYATPRVEKIHWDSQDGKVLRFVCQGILPR
ncbi:hypothetical protein [Novosphingobium mangrovi (ex Huang et al. 2023)]|uniref:DUF2147 domain-containing protein n=1 Tax=Novosphingobium mangrovi (ex Huang et al. 2023) TaxID=2976432 RepID=A0ABT2I364_9SPHN|nr:hypothetical protein [Novosphingobium mangrovi (ex Huang et al. 2023)]MCT2399251.1 hypothetical protein [Novosphingobium mangrovi (ex Huang et al. 2023)]